jgi:para-aminobenzoate synthetase/4-amino-4-deoxychorismate lyase
LTRWTQLPEQLHSLVADNPGSVLLQTSRFDAWNRQSFVFLDAIETISASRLDEIPDLFRRVEEALAGGFYVAGFMGYECGYHFERFDGVSLEAQELPLAWFGIYRAPVVFDHARGCFEGGFVLPPIAAPPDELMVPFAEKAALEISEDDYCAKIRQIKEYIRAGETYQVNFADRVRVKTEASAGEAFGALITQQPVAYSALLNIEGHHVLSLSPELFFRIEDGRIVTRPMKGTMHRGLDRAEDSEAAERLRSDEKNRAEHVMIVDLLRNDLGRICEMGSVQVEDIFSVERYRTLLQMTSTVSGKLRGGLSYYEIFKAMFPSGSITGAPKIRTMEIINAMERVPRGVYTGAIGVMSPDGTATFNVAIRTLVLKDGEAWMGVGGGIVADSEPQDEYQECLLKAEFLTRRGRDFQLIETMLWDGEFFLLAMHLDRMEASAEYFDFPFDRDVVTTRLVEEARGFRLGERYRVRLLLDGHGKMTVTSAVFAADQTVGRVGLSAERTFSGDVFLRHKTTRRELYEREYVRARADGLDEVIFLNERGEVTEGAISNVFIRQAGKLLTPPLRSGVLPGVFRRHLLETDAGAEERVLTVRDLETADAIFVGNSVRGLREVKLLKVDNL